MKERHSEEDSICSEIKVNNCLMYHHKTKKTFVKQSNQSNEKEAHRVGDIFSSYISDKGLISRLYKELNKQRFKNSKTQVNIGLQI